METEAIKIQGHIETKAKIKPWSYVTKGHICKTRPHAKQGKMEPKAIWKQAPYGNQDHMKTTAI